MIYEEILKLKNKIINGEITEIDAKELYFSSSEKSRSWHTKDWKERRDKIIKNHCEICGSTEILTLQHLSHPQKYKEYEKKVVSKYEILYIKNNGMVEQQELQYYVSNNFDYEPINLCPNCGNRNPNHRIRKKPKYLCTACRLEFDDPIHKTAETIVNEFYLNPEAVEVNDKCFISRDKYNNKMKLSMIQKMLLRNKAKEKYEEEIIKDALLSYLDDNIKYLSFEDTITCCKRCAYHRDIKNMELCPVCKTYYKGISYPTCIQCLPPEKRAAAQEKIESGKMWKELHELLEI